MDAPENWPRTLVLWRSNLFGSSAKGNEYFLRNLLGTHNNVLGQDHAEGLKPKDVKWHEQAPEGKLDLLVSADFRMTSTTLLSDVVFPAATWYEKHDLSSTDMHPFVHAFTPAIDPPWETKTDFDTFHLLAQEFSRQAETHLGVRRDLVSVPLQHDTPGQLAQPGGIVRDWRDMSIPAVPGQNMPIFSVVERDYTAIADKLAAVGPLADKLGFTVKNVTYKLAGAVGPAQPLQRGDARRRRGRPSRDRHRRENGRGHPGVLRHHQRRAVRPGLQGPGNPHREETGGPGRGLRGKIHHLRPDPGRPGPGDHLAGVVRLRDRRPALRPFTINVERLKPWHTLTGRMHFFLDHDWIRDIGEALPIYRPPLDMHRLFGEPKLGQDGSMEVVVRYLTPHSKWSIHSEYQDNLLMLSLSRGGPTVWMSPADAAAIEVKDNDWVECLNINGVLVARAIVSHRMPAGVVYVHHAQERTIDVPKSEATGRRGGIHNSVTRLLVKPSHLIGGYAQLAYAFNYLGPTGNQRDMVATVRRRSQEVQY